MSAGDAEQRAREAERRRRSEDLARRLAEQDQHDRKIAERERHRTSKQRPGRRLTRVAAPIAVIALVGAGLWATGAIGTAGSTSGLAPTVAPDPNAPTPGQDSNEDRLAPLPAEPTVDGPWEYMQTSAAGEPVTYDPCRPIRWVYNADGAPPGSEPLVFEAVEKTAAATGLSFEYEGPTSEEWSKEREPYQPSNYGDRWVPVLIAWSDEQATPGLGGYIAGLGGSQSYDPGTGEGPVFVTGSVVLDSGDLGAVPLEVPEVAEAVRATIQHELGHVVGLDHVADPGEVMNTEGGDQTATEWGPGDLQGLRRMGDGECRPDV